MHDGAIPYVPDMIWPERRGGYSDLLLRSGKALIGPL